MPETTLKALYLGTCLNDLKKIYSEEPKGTHKLLGSVVIQLFHKGNVHRKEGDEEKSYVSYMKFLNYVTYLQKSKLAAVAKQHYLAAVEKVHVDEALKYAEELSNSLEKRYKLLKEQQQQQQQHEAELLGMEKSKAKGALKMNSSKSATIDSIQGSITSKQLYSLLSETTKKVLIVDSRPEKSYQESHLKLPNTVNVPQEIVRAGITANSLQNLLSLEAKEWWSRRQDMDLIVLLDWTTTSKTLTPGSNLYVLKNILIEWDPYVSYKHDPLILEGGYEDWLLHYPTMTTNPHVTPPLPSNDSLDVLLDAIDYPSLDAPAMPGVDRALKPSELSVVGTSLLPTPRPSVDRGLKATAVATYQERARVLSQLAAQSEGLLQVQRSRLEQEQAWELLRLEREKAAEEELREQLQRKEEQLLESITQLEQEQQTKEAENRRLREMLQEYMSKETDGMVQPDMNQGEQEDELHKKICASNEQARQVSYKAEKLQRERLRKEEEERRKEQIEEHLKEDIERRREEKEKADKEKGMYLTPLRDSASASSSSMKRSHSSPNITQLNDDDDVGVKQKAPQFDRAIKPLQKPKLSDVNDARQRDFSEIYGQVGRGLTGLKNLGNSCYMNSIMQCISNTTPLVYYFVEGFYRDDINRQHKTRGQVAEEVAAVVRAMWSMQFRSIACHDLKNVIGQYEARFEGCEQQDSHEFLTMLMNWLHEDLNKKDIRNPSKNHDVDDLPPEEREWKKFCKSNESLILKLFFGQQKSTVSCCTCGEKSVTYEPFSNLSLPLPNTNTRCTLDDCIQLYLREEKLAGWKCPKCRAARDAFKKFDILKLPPVLIVHFKRFHHDGWSRKRQTFVDFPLTNLDMARYSTPNQPYTTYDLYGVSNHYGTMEGGHYTAYCKNYSKWYKFDDQIVSELSHNDVKTGAAYILFYIGINFKKYPS